MEGGARRDRDAAGRARSARPRDAAGRPLPYGAEGVPRVREDLVLGAAEALAEAERLLAEGLPFHAHEVLEVAWKAAPPDEAELWRGLAQLAVGLTHVQRRNARGAETLLRRGAQNLAPYAARPPHGVAVSALVAWAEAAAGTVATEGPPADVTRTRPALRGSPDGGG